MFTMDGLRKCSSFISSNKYKKPGSFFKTKEQLANHFSQKLLFTKRIIVDPKDAPQSSFGKRLARNSIILLVGCLLTLQPLQYFPISRFYSAAMIKCNISVHVSSIKLARQPFLLSEIGLGTI